MVLAGAAAEAVPAAGVGAGVDEDDEPVALAGVEAGEAFGADFAVAPFLEDDGLVLAGSAALSDSTLLLQPSTNQTRTLFIPAYLESPLSYFNPKTPLIPSWRHSSLSLPLDCLSLTA